MEVTEELQLQLHAVFTFLDLDAVASSAGWHSTPSFNSAVYSAQVSDKATNPKVEVTKNTPNHQGSSVPDLQSAHGLVPNTASSNNKDMPEGRVAFVIKKQMGKGTAKSASARFGHDGEVAYLKVGQSNLGQVTCTSLVQIHFKF